VLTSANATQTNRAGRPRSGLCEHFSLQASNAYCPSRTNGASYPGPGSARDCCINEEGHFFQDGAPRISGLPSLPDDGLPARRWFLCWDHDGLDGFSPCWPSSPSWPSSPPRPAHAHHRSRVFHDSGSFQVADCGGGVVLTDTFTAVNTFTVFFDASGNPVRLQMRGNFDGVITNSASGNTYRTAPTSPSS
jgi:hypothetical protein